MGRVEGKVAFITGAARGQGRSHAVRLAEEGADIIAVDVCGPIPTVTYPHSTPEDLQETVRQVEKLDRQIVARQVDLRDLGALQAAFDEGVDQLGRIDIVSAGAGIMGQYARAWEYTPEQWQTTIDINLTSVWHTVKVSVPRMIAQGAGGSIVITSSSAGFRGHPNISNYVAAKHAVVGLTKSLAKELAEHWIRVNAILPGNVDTPLTNNQATYQLFRPDLENPTYEDAKAAYASIHILPLPFLQPVDISNALLWLASDEARFVTAAAFPIDAGQTQV